MNRKEGRRTVRPRRTVVKQHLQPPIRLAIDLILPLLHQSHGTDDERRLALDLLAVGRVGENETEGLNRLSESHVVREDTTAVLS